jgi:hypothetical protein
VKQSSRAPMLRQVSSMVRASALRKSVFILAKALFDRIEVWRVGGQEEEVGFCDVDGGANGAAFMTAEVLHDDNVAGRERREEKLLDISAEACAIDRPSMTHGAVSRSQRGAARDVRVGHRPKGALATRRSLLAHRPWVRVRLVFAQVSSMKRSRLGSIVA